jgi:hypothetical protein
MISQVSLLWPSDGNFPAAPPFSDTRLNGIAFTGRVSPATDGCTSHSIRTLPDGTRLDTCTRVAHTTPYRALTEVRLRIPGLVNSKYTTAPTPTAVPANPVRGSTSDIVWTSFENAFP